MKSFFVIAAGVLSAVSQASAAVTVITPWASTTWTSGEHGAISWNATGADASLKCDIQMLNGDYTNANLVAAITAVDTPIACSSGAFDIYPLNDFASGKYWIRIGQASTNTWGYSGEFTFAGKGSAKAYSVVGGPSAAVSGAAVPTGSAAATASGTSAPKTTGGASAAAASASKSASASTSGASGFTMSKAAVAIGAVAAVALTL
ncbi:hypothetical protein K501DRAFT_206330 [Backusella circina FSU 941]|nr:hypothetical protein K501DRAFT_206330 [Backusella circina FSU 941]